MQYSVTTKASCSIGVSGLALLYEESNGTALTAKCNKQSLFSASGKTFQYSMFCFVSNVLFLNTLLITSCLDKLRFFKQLNVNLLLDSKRVI